MEVQKKYALKIMIKFSKSVANPEIEGDPPPSRINIKRHGTAIPIKPLKTGSKENLKPPRKQTSCTQRDEVGIQRLLRDHPGQTQQGRTFQVPKGKEDPSS